MGIAAEPKIHMQGELVVLRRETLDLSLEGDSFPDCLTSYLQIEPAYSARRGEPNWESDSRRPEKNSVWIWRTPKRLHSDCELVVLEVLDQFEPVKDRLVEAATRLGLQIQVGVLVEMTGVMQNDADFGPGPDVRTPSLALGAATISRMAGMQAALDVDQYVYCEEASA